MSRKKALEDGNNNTMKKNWIKADKFTFLQSEEVEKLTDEEYAAYKDDEILYLQSVIKNAENKASKEDIEALNKELTDIYKRQAEEAENRLKKISEALTKQVEELKAKGVDKNSSEFEKAIKEVFEKEEKDKSWRTSIKEGRTVGILKATQTYGDIVEGSDFAQMRSEITDQPLRRVTFRELFRTTPMTTEVYKYPYQSTVNRDAQNVAVCSPVTSNTKETITVGEIGYKKIKDRIDFCLDFVQDYPFMRNRIDILLNQSLSLKVDQQIFLGTGLLEETNSINSYSSEFSAANPVCDLTTSIQTPNLVDLISGMATQIYELGQQNEFISNTAIVNNCDWFKDVESLKDANNNYLDTRVVIIGGVVYITTMAGPIRIVTSPIVPQNNCWVFDSSKGEILDRMSVEVDMAMQNGTNWENDIVSLKGSTKLQFFVDPNYENAFMKCSDVAAALVAITKP